jgi:hypothetical protein
VKAAVHVVPCAGVLKAASDVAGRNGGMGGGGLVHAGDRERDRRRA